MGLSGNVEVWEIQGIRAPAGYMSISNGFDLY